MIFSSHTLRYFIEIALVLCGSIGFRVIVFGNGVVVIAQDRLLLSEPIKNWRLHAQGGI